MMTIVKDAQEERELNTGERRRGLRIAQQRPVKVFAPMSLRFIGGETRDISGSGLQIELPASAPVDQGRILNIHVGVGSSGEALVNRRNMIPARVVWVRRDANARLTAGVEFLVGSAAHRDAA